MSNSSVISRGVLADALPQSVAINSALVLGGAAFVGLLAQISIPLPFTPVPITGQTLGVLVVGASLGSLRGAASMTLYFLGGLAGLPWYAGHAHGFAPATTGYLLGFILAAVVAGELSRRGFSRAWWRAIPVMLASEMVIFALGVSWLKVDLGVTWSTAIAYGLTPFWVGEIVKATLAGLVMPASWRAVWRLTR